MTGLFFGVAFIITFMLVGVFGSLNFLLAVGGFFDIFDFNPRLKLIIDKFYYYSS